MEQKTYHVYILTNPSHTVLYIGVTGSIERRMWEHREKLVEGFTKTYNCSKLIYLEETGDVLEALEREKQLKKWSRKKKEDLIRRVNPNWDDLFLE